MHPPPFTQGFPQGKRKNEKWKMKKERKWSSGSPRKGPAVPRICCGCLCSNWIQQRETTSMKTVSSAKGQIIFWDLLNFFFKIITPSPVGIIPSCILKYLPSYHTLFLMGDFFSKQCWCRWWLLNSTGRCWLSAISSGSIIKAVCVCRGWGCHSLGAFRSRVLLLTWSSGSCCAKLWIALSVPCSLIISVV